MDRNWRRIIRCPICRRLITELRTTPSPEAFRIAETRGCSSWITNLPHGSADRYRTFIRKRLRPDYPNNIFPNVATPYQSYCCDRKIDATQANATLTPNPTTVVALRWGFNRFYSRTTQESAGFSLSALGLPQLAGITTNHRISRASHWDRISLRAAIPPRMSILPILAEVAPIRTSITRAVLTGPYPNL